MISQDELIGFIGFDWVEKQPAWSKDFINILQISGELISSAIKRESRRHELERRREYLPHPYQSLDPEGTIVSVNDAWLDFLGKEREKIINREFVDFLPEKARGKFEDILPKLKNNGSVSGIELELQRQDGTLRLVSFDGRVEFDETDDIVQIHCQFNDITERKQFETIIENSPDITLLHDETGTAKYVSPSIEREMGYDPESLTGENPFKDIHPDDRDRMMDAISRLIAEPDTVVTEEYRIQNAEGSYVCVESRGKNLNDVQGVEGILLNARVIEERKTYENKLERMEYIVQRMNDGAVIVEDGVIRYANPGLSELLGYTEDEVVGTAIGEHIAPEYRETMEKRQQAGMSGDDTDLQNQYELELCSADGEQIPVEINIAPIEHDGQPAGLTIIRDITERKSQEERFQAYIEHSNDVISVVGADGVYKYQSPSSKRVVRYAPSELVGEDVFQYVHPDDREETIEAFTEAVDDTEKSPTHELRFSQKEGSYRWLAIRGNNQLDNPAIEGYVLNSHDITKRKEREQELQRKRDRLDKFARVLSHDLRNPLNVATGRLDLVIEDCDSEHLETVAESLTRMENLIDDVLTLARAGETVGEFETVELADLIGSCWQNVDTKLAELLAETDTAIRADASRLTELFENLLRNAVEQGGNDVTVTIGDLDEGFYIEDDGPGIPQADREKVFEAGYSSREEGTGFGLSIVKEIIEAQDWEIQVVEGTEGGARFEIDCVDVVDN